MKKLSILLTGLMFTTSFAQEFVSQATVVPVVNANNGTSEVLLEQVAFGTSGIISDTGASGEIVASADDIDLTYDATKITKISAFGFDNAMTISTQGTGVSFYIIADEDWYPEGSDPRETNLYAFEMTIGDAGFDFIDNGDTSYQFDLDLNVLGEDVVLPAGKYWISVVANTTIADITAANRWNWYQNLSANGVGGHLTDPLDLFGAGATTWTDIASLTGWTESDLSMIVEGEETTMGVSDVNAASVTVYPNPATNFVKATVKNGEVSAMTVMNMNGQVVASAKAASVNVSALPAGVYVVKVQDAKGNVTTSKVVKK
ncbi:T9SS type A sorting domain-containing protein [Moheibacter lacus]|uniref:T9SS type A sorting domain-containing protein n=1 Tax=Moheibacter lacus TaxID=2745851 RepID=A0A838ZH83_9FLAO|nr:T9SS type A sorting domain-containing protein [Moheibacter lacus]MBA5628618.1 T9SS type A sorting domain-containing protein [Moheibacter lacus]